MRAEKRKNEEKTEAINNGQLCLHASHLDQMFITKFGLPQTFTVKLADPWLISPPKQRKIVGEPYTVLESSWTGLCFVSKDTHDMTISARSVVFGRHFKRSRT